MAEVVDIYPILAIYPHKKSLKANQRNPTDLPSH
jgi:hypothetical protein